MKVTLLKILDTKTGEGKNGTWTNVQFLAKTDAKFDPDVAFKARNEVAKEILDLPIGCDIEIMYQPKSREYNGKWYTDCEVWKIAELTSNVHPPAQESTPITPNPNVESTSTFVTGAQDDLPF